MSNLYLRCETYPDFNRRTSGSTEPIPVGGEAKSINDVIVIQSVEMLLIMKIPEHGLGVLASGSTQRTIRRDGDSVQVSSVLIVSCLQLAVSKVPDLQNQSQKLNLGFTCIR